MDAREQRKLEVLQTWLEQRIDEAESPIATLGGRALSAVGRVLGLFSVARSIGHSPSSGGGKPSPTDLYREFLDKDPDAVVSVADMKLVLEYVVESRALGVDDRNHMILKGDTLILWYRGRSAYSGKHAVAGRYVRELLATPHRSVDPTDLVRIYGSAKKIEDRRAADKDAEYAAGDYGGSLVREAREKPRSKGDKTDAPDPEALISVRKRLRTVKAKLAGLKDDATGEKAAYEEEKEALEHYLRQSAIPTGKAGDGKKAANAVRNLVKNQLVPHVQAQHPELAEHLAKSLTFGANGCTYDPSPEEEWICG